MSEPPRNVFQYAIVRVVPSVERGEGLNAGIVLLCRPMRFLGARVALDEGRLAALAPDLDPAHGAAAPRGHRTGRGGRSRRPGPIAGMGQAERFHWLVAPASTIIQPSAVHTGLCDDPAAELDHLVATLVGSAGGRRSVPEAALRGRDRILERLASMRARDLDDERRPERRRAALGRRERALEPVGGGVGRP